MRFYAFLKTETKIVLRSKMRMGGWATVILWMSKMSTLKTDHSNKQSNSTHIFPSGLGLCACRLVCSFCNQLKEVINSPRKDI